MLKKMTKAQVIAHVRKHGSWNGLVCASKMYPIIGQTAMYLDLVWNDDRGVCVKDEETLEITENDGYQHMPRKFDHWYNAWAFYNTSYEEGYYAAYYLIK